MQSSKIGDIAENALPLQQVDANMNAQADLSVAADVASIHGKVRELADLVAAQIEQKMEPVEVLEKLNITLNESATLLNSGLEGEQNLQARKEFYLKVLKSVATKLLDGKVLNSNEYLPQILRFFKNVLINFYPYDLENESLCEVVHQIFNLDASLYTVALQSSSGIKRTSAQDTGDGEPSREQIRVEQEREWRKSLKVGDRLDAVKLKNNQQYRIQCWSRGHVSKIYDDDTDSFQILFDHDYPSTHQIVHRFAYQIAPEGTFTDDIEWRYKLAPNDQVDCLDQESTWYRSTVLEVKESQVSQENTIQEAYVGFRVYEEEATKMDDEGRHYAGWSNKYDEWKPVTCPTIQKHNTVVKHYKQAGKSLMVYENVLDDLNDVLYDTKERKVWAVYRQNFFANLRCIADYVNEFGRRGGFERILAFLQSPSESRKVSLKHLYYIMDFLSKTQPLWQKQFACYYIPKVKEAFEIGLLYTNPQGTGPTQLPFLKETLTEIQKSFQKIIRRHYTTYTLGHILAQLQFSLGFSLLKSEKLEKRIQGLKEIVEQVKLTKFVGRKNLSTKEVVSKLKDNNIFEVIFGDNYHIQLIQRSTEIIRFLINEKELGENEINQIWSSTKKDQQTKIEVYKIINETASMFRNEEIEVLVKHFASVDPESFVDKEIECVYELSKYSYRVAAFQAIATKLFWSIAVQEKPYKNQIIELAIEKLVEIIRTQERDQKLIYIINCVNNIAVNKAPLQSIKILTKLLEQIPNYKSQNQPTLYDICNQLIDEYQLLEKLVVNIVDYSISANEEWEKGTINAENIENVELMGLPFSHRNNLCLRLNFLRLMLQNSQTQLKKEHLDQLWELLTINSHISVDSDIFFNWLKLIINDHNKLSPSLTKHFFNQNICREGVSFRNIKKSGFDCICSLFLQINEQDDKLMIISFSNMGNVAGQANNKLDFRVHVLPNELDGIEVIWKMLQECDKKDFDLTSVVIDLVTKIYHNLSSLIYSRIHEVEDQFIHESLSRLTHVVNDPEQLPEEKEQMASITSLMIKSFFEDSEKNGTAGLNTHLSIDKKQYLKFILVQNNITSQKNTPKMILINAYANMTIWDLKKIIAEKCKISPCKVQINRSDTKKRPITDALNIKLLDELKFTDYELLTAQKKPIVYQTRVPLLSSKKQLVPEAKKIFSSWFDRFQEDGLMTPQQCVEFVVYSTGDQTVNVADTRVIKLFEDFDSDGDGKLTLDDFLNFYKERSLQKPELVWGNLQTHNIGNDLRPLSQTYNYDDDINEIKQKELLPRYKLSVNQEAFDYLFELIGKLHGEGQNKLWNLINSLRTNPKIYSDLLTLSSIQEVKESNQAHKLLYYLQIFESFIVEHQVKRETEITCYYLESSSSFNSYPSLDQAAEGGSSINNGNSSNEQSNPAGPKSGNGSSTAIPLPSNNFNEGVYSAAVGGNVPQPPTQVPFIGPVPPPGNAQNATQDKEKIVQLIQSFKGNCIKETISNSIFTAEDLQDYLPQDVLENIDQVKAEWINRFINGDGFQLLTQLLTNLNTNCKRQDVNEVLKNKVEKECLTQILKIIKILLMSAFCANAPTEELSLKLQRKMSSKIEPSGQNGEEDKIDEKALFGEALNTTSNVTLAQQEQENTAKEFVPLIDLFKGEVGRKILTSLDFKQFQQQILQVIQIVLRKTKSLGVDDKVIIEQALSLWICCIIQNAELLNYIYGEPADIELGQSSENITSILVEEGLVCQNYSIRELFKDNLLFICQNVKSQTIEELPGFFFLKTLIKGLPTIEDRHRETKQYFQLLKSLLNYYFEAEKFQPFVFKKLFENSELLLLIIKRLSEYKPNERKGGVLEDYTLEGYLQLINLLIQNDPTSLKTNQIIELTQQLVERYLFTFKYDSLNQHITKNVDIAANEASFINKCQTTESRQAAYTLLITLCTLNPSMIGELISNYWYPLLNKVKKPKKADYAPKSEGRSFLGYVGLKNLGSICYMISMIQQFFHIPAFRYQMLSVQDNKAPQMSQFEGENVDDNVLHQFQKLLGFLELSDRQDYNPAEFCCSFKDYDGQPINVRIQQDSQEFLNVFFDKLDNILANTSQKYLLKNIFGGKTCSMFICKSCGNVKQRQEDFYNLPVEVKNQKSVYEGLKKFVTGEIINDYQCEACNQKVDVEKKTVIEKLPNTLILHLQRIVFDFDTLQNSKLNSRVEFPNVLNLKPYMLSQALMDNEALKKQSKSKRQASQKAEDQKQALSESNQNQTESREDEKQEEEGAVQGQNGIAGKGYAKGNANDQELLSSDGEDIEMNKKINEVGLQNKAVEDDDKDYEYKLVGVVVHMGTADAGHYISYININRYQNPASSPEWLKTENEKWLEFNDSLVKDYKFKSIEEDCYGGASSSMTTSSDFKNDYSRNAYMLIYDKRVKEKMKVVLTEELLKQKDYLKQNLNLQQSLDCDRATISSESLHQNNAQNVSQVPHLLYVLPQVKESAINGVDVKYDEEHKESYALVDFGDVQKFIPNEIYKVEHEDNQIFLSEKHVFNNSFFKCTQQLIEMMVKQSADSLSVNDDSCQRLFAFMERLVFDLLSMTSENKQLKELTQLYLSMLAKNDAQTIQLINKRILNIDNQLKLTKNDKTFMEHLLSNMDKEVRETCQTILTFAVNRLFEIQGASNELLDTIMNNVLGLMPDDCSKNWLKIEQYLTFLYNTTKSGAMQLDYMVKKGLVTKLIDFFLENDSPLSTNLRRQQMGSNYANPPFEYLIRTVAFIARNVPRIVDPALQVLPPAVNQDEAAGYNLSDQLSGLSHQQLGEEVAPSPSYLKTFDNYVVCLSADDIKMLTLKQFYVKAMKNDYETNEMGLLAAHVAYENIKFSRSLSKNILLGINTANGDNVQPHLNLLEPFLGVEDSLQVHRYEWLLGIPQIKLERSNVYNLPPGQSNLKAGVGLIDHVTDEVQTYKSTLFKTSTNVKDSLLQILYQYRKRWQKYSLLLLQVLLRAILNDQSNLLCKYILTMPSPIYTFENYFGWIGPYLQETIDNCARNNGISSYKQDQLLAINIQSLLESVDEKISQMPVQVQISSVSGKTNNQAAMLQNLEPYLVWRIIEEKQIDTRYFNEGSIQVNTYELMCDISESAPNGLTNLAIPASQFGSHNSQMHNNPYSSNYQNRGGAVSQRPVAQSNNARGNFNGQPIQTRRNQPARGIKKKKGKQIIVQKVVPSHQDYTSNTAAVQAPQDGDEQLLDPASGQGPVMQQQCPQDASTMDVDFEEEEDNAEAYEDEDDEATDVPTGADGAGSSNQLDQDFVAEGHIVDQDDQNSRSQQAPPTGIVPNVAAGNGLNRDEINNDAVRDDYWQERVPAIIGFTVRNNDTMNTQQTVVTFIDKSQGSDEKLNVRLPVSSLPCQVLCGKEREIIIFQKIRPFDGWGQFDLDVQVIAPRQNYPPQLSGSSANVGSNVGASFTINPQSAAYNNQETYPVDFNAQDEVGDVDMVAAQGGKKICKFCTYANCSLLPNCEICYNPLN